MSNTHIEFKTKTGCIITVPKVALCLGVRGETQPRYVVWEVGAAITEFWELHQPAHNALRRKLMNYTTVEAKAAGCAE